MEEIYVWFREEDQFGFKKEKNTMISLDYRWIHTIYVLQVFFFQKQGADMKRNGTCEEKFKLPAHCINLSDSDERASAPLVM